MNENGNGNGQINGGGSIGGDSSDSPNSDSKTCRDFMRNVCQRGKNCRFLHPENTKIRTDPIFCHDFQQGRCFRSNCKFIHCTPEEEEHYKTTGELPQGVDDPANDKSNATKGLRGPKIKSPAINGSLNGDAQDAIPLCKDFLKGVCDRPPGGCKFRHVSRGPTVGVPVYGRPMRGRGIPPPLAQGRRKLSGYEDAPDTKRFQLDDYGYGYEGDEGLGYSSLPPGPLTRLGMSQGHPHYTNMTGYLSSTSTHLVPSRNNNYQSDSPYFHQNSSPHSNMKSLEEENFMLKRRIEELKSSNEFLLAQNAQLRLNNSLSATLVPTSVAQVQPLAVSAVSVSGAGPVAQPTSIIGITSSSLSATQPLPTISISTLPTVSINPPVSISQTLQPQAQSQTQISFLPPN